MNAVTWLAPLSSWLVMVHLGAKDQAQFSTPSARSNMAFYLSHYAAPLAVVWLLHGSGVVASQESYGLAVCVLSGVGTSAVPWALRDGASADAVSRRLALGAAVALICLPLISLAHASQGQALAHFAATASILIGAMWLPWRVGRWLAQRMRLSPSWLASLGKAATLSVVTLILLVAWRELPRLPERPWLIAAGFLLVVAQGIGGALLDARTGLATTAVVRNLTLATLVLVASSETPGSLTALAAFGTLMYIAVWPTSWLAGFLKTRSPHAVPQEHDTR